MSLPENNSRFQDDKPEEFGYATEKPHFFRFEGRDVALSVNAIQRGDAKQAKKVVETIEFFEKKQSVQVEKDGCKQNVNSFRKVSDKPKAEKTEKTETKNQHLLRTLKPSDIKQNTESHEQSKKGDLLRRAMMVLFAVVMVVSALNIVYQTIAKYYADKYYDTLRDSFYSDEMQTDNISYLSRDTVFPAEERLYSDDGDIYSAPDLETVDMHEKYERMLPNLQALKKINTNVFAWIKVEGTRVDYPVVRSPQGNNDYYLDHALDRTYSVSGSVFMDYTNAIKLSNNRNTCIYGHNMNDGTMFQTIMNFRTRNQFLNGQIEVYTADGIYIYTPFSVYDAVPTERFFHTQFADDADFGLFLEEITSKSIFKAGVTPDIKDKVITLITCTNTVTDKRFVVHGVLTDVVK